jgi:predicted MFS family arabinose efflux permease
VGGLEARPELADTGVRVTPKRAAVGAFLTFGGFWGAWASLVPSVKEATGLSQGQLGLALLCIGLGSVPAMALVGVWIDRFGDIVLPGLLAVLAATVVLPAFANSLTTLSAALLVVGAASGSADVALNAEISALEADTGERLMPLAHALFSAGVIVGAVLSGLARQLGAGRPVILGGVAVVLALTAWLNRHPSARVVAARGGKRKLRGPLVAIGIVCAVAFVVEGGLEGWSALFLERELDQPPAISALGPGAFAVGMVMGRLSAQRLHRYLSDAKLLTVGACVSIAGLLAVSSVGVAAFAIGSFFVGGAGISFVAPTLFGAAGRGAPEAERGAAMATVTTLGYLGFLLGPPIVGGVAQTLGLRASFVVLAGAAAIVALASPRLRL